MFKIVIAVVLLAHGIGHVLGPLQVSKVAGVNQSWNGDSWLLTGAVGQSITGAVGVALWTVAIVAFGVLAGVVMGWLPEAWTPLAIVASVVSLVGVLLFPGHSRPPARSVRSSWTWLSSPRSSGSTGFRAASPRRIASQAWTRPPRRAPDGRRARV